MSSNTTANIRYVHVRAVVRRLLRLFEESVSSPLNHIDMCSKRTREKTREKPTWSYRDVAGPPLAMWVKTIKHGNTVPQTICSWSYFSSRRFSRPVPMFAEPNEDLRSIRIDSYQNRLRPNSRLNFLSLRHAWCGLYFLHLNLVFLTLTHRLSSHEVRLSLKQTIPWILTAIIRSWWIETVTDTAKRRSLIQLRVRNIIILTIMPAAKYSCTRSIDREELKEGGWRVMDPSKRQKKERETKDTTRFD